VQGSILTRRITIEDGAGLRGKVEMIRANDSANSWSAAATAETKTEPKAIAAGSQSK
jgi:cytoskeletal protein CcmA (bactofilin family)